MPTTDCLFCKIAGGEVAADVVFENDHVVAFKDINPQAPTHVLIIPRRHVATINDLSSQHADDIGQLFLAARYIAEEAGIAENGYRVAMNCNDDGGQSVYHVHLHLLGGAQDELAPWLIKVPWALAAAFPRGSFLRKLPLKIDQTAVALVTT